MLSRPIATETQFWDYPFANPEGLDFQASSEQAAAVESLGDIPLVVLGSHPDIYLAPGLPDEVAAALRQLWQDTQAELVELSANSTLVIANQRGGIFDYQSGLIVDTVVEMVGQVRNR